MSHEAIITQLVRRVRELGAGSDFVRLLDDGMRALQDDLVEAELRVSRRRLQNEWGELSNEYGFIVEVRANFGVIARGRGRTLFEALSTLSTDGIPEA